MLTTRDEVEAERLDRGRFGGRVVDIEQGGAEAQAGSHHTGDAIPSVRRTSCGDAGSKPARSMRSTAHRTSSAFVASGYASGLSPIPTRRCAPNDSAAET